MARRHDDPAASDAGARQRRVRAALHDNLEYVLLLPAIAAIVAFLWLPFFKGVWMSFHRWPLTGTPEWVGLGNYVELVTADRFVTSVRATLGFWLSTVAHLVVGLVAALLVANLDRFKNLVSGVFLLSYAVPAVSTATIWLFLLDPDFGPVFTALVDWGVLDAPIYWSTHGDTALATITAVASWTFWPFVFLILLASRESIPESHYEAARIYGASRFQAFRRVTLPQLKSAILVALSLRLIWNVAKITQPLQMTQGGPGWETSVLGILLYRMAWQTGEMGRAFTVGVVLAALAFAASAVFIREFERGSRGEES